MAKKMLFCATVDFHFKAFHLPYMRWFKEQGWEVHVAANGNTELPYVDKRYNLSIQRSPFKLNNLKAYQELKSILSHENYEIIHCHTPMGGVLARLAAREARANGTKVIYTAHGFHFCKGAPLINWLIYYPIEKVLSHFTDCLITINEEDYALAVKHRFKAQKIERVHGVGVNTERFQPFDATHKQDMRTSLGYKQEDFLMFYAAEFNKNKNQQLLIEALALIKDEYPTAKLLLAGEGPLKEKCSDLARQLGVSSMVDFLGYRNDIELILPMCDIAVASSVREGLPVNIMEAMACGLPIIACDNRGHRELVCNHENGWILQQNDSLGISDKIKLLIKDKVLRLKLGQSGREIMQKTYAIPEVLKEKSSIYKDFMGGDESLKWATQ
jgi:glycosyltransferase EpsD